MYKIALNKKYSMIQLYQAFVLAFRSMPRLIQNRKYKHVDPKFIERLMLATTEVNGCEVCSYAHTQLALKEGFSKDEIEAFLSGSKAYVNPDEATGILYAQHVADSMGHPDTDAYVRLVKEYGQKEAEIIVAAINVMMMGNISGIPLSAFLRRLKRKAYTNSTLFYELSMLLVQPLFMIVALLQVGMTTATRQITLMFSK
jgi:AhpD family alkylhydroperoxidase